jgi:hypothetical protein
MGLSWQQGPLSPGAIGRFLVPEPLPSRLLYAEPLRRRMRVRFGGNWIADSEDVILLFEPGRYPMAYFRQTDVSQDTLERIDRTTRHPISASPPGTPFARAIRVRREERGSTPIFPRMHKSDRDELRSRGLPWMPSTKKTSASWVMLLTVITASTFASPPAISWFGSVTASSQIQGELWSSTSPASLRVGTFFARTSMSPR